VVAGARSDRITFIAASLAYYAFISLLPLLLLALVVASTLGREAVIEPLVASVSRTLGEAAGGLVGDALSGAAGRGGATLLGVAVLLWSGLKLFRGLDIAFSEVYGAPGPTSLLAQLRNAVVALGAVAVGIAGVVGVGAGLALVGADAAIAGVDLFGVAGTLGLVAGLTVAFLPLYYLLPGPEVTAGEALPGAVFAAVGWTVLQTAFRVYAASAGQFEAYGVIGGVLLLVTFLYVGALLLLVGAVLNAVRAGRADERTGLSADDPGAEPTAVLEGTMTQDRLDDDASDAELREALEQLSDELDRFEERIDDRTVHREDLEADLRRYVRARNRRGKARGWGPYLVLLYGTVMTLGAFFFLGGGWAVLAMVVVWLSTLGLYALMLLVGTTVAVAGLPGRLKDRLGDR
jgi:YihY family inner membrane protein